MIRIKPALQPTKARSTGFLTACALVAVFAVLPQSAFAACSTPSGIAGDIIYNGTYNVLQYCNGSNWINAGTLVASGGSTGTLVSGDFCTTNGTMVNCATPATGSGNVVLSASPTLTGMVVGASSTWAGSVAIGTTTTSGALNVAGTVTATGFSGSGASLTGIGTSSLGGITGSPGSTTFLAGNGTWTSLAGAGAATGSGTTNNVALWSGATTLGTSNIYQSGSYVGIGTTSPASGDKLHVYGGRVRIDESEGTGYSGVLELTNGTNTNYVFTSGTGDATTGDLYLYTGGSKNLILQAGGGTTGNVGINTTSPIAKLDVEGTGPTYTYPSNYSYLNNSTTNYTGNCCSGSSIGVAIYAAGRVVSNAEFDAVSDRRKKENIKDITSSVADSFLSKVKPVQFNWIGKKDDGLKYGFIAQEVIKAGFGNLVGLHPDPGMAGSKDQDGFVSPKDASFDMSYQSVVPILVKAAQDLKHLFDSDHDLLLQMKADNDKLRAEFEAYKQAHP